MVGPGASPALLGKSRKWRNWERETSEDGIKEIMQNQEEELKFFKHLSILLGVFANFGQGNL